MRRPQTVPALRWRHRRLLPKSSGVDTHGSIGTRELWDHITFWLNVRPAPLDNIYNAAAGMDGTTTSVVLADHWCCQRVPLIPGIQRVEYDSRPWLG